MSNGVSLGRVLTMLVMLTSAACLIEPNPRFDEHAVATNGVCTDLAAPGGDQCPAACTSCHGNVCSIECIGDNACDGVDIVCPEDYVCDVICDGPNACSTGSVTCPELHACSLICEGGVAACGNLALLCGQGSCSMGCFSSNSVCEGASVECGAGLCSATCSGASQPSMPGCDAACSCMQC